MIGPDLDAVCTRRKHRFTQPNEIVTMGRPLFMYPDAYWARGEGSAIYLRRLLDDLILRAAGGSVIGKLSQRQSSRIFAYSGADPFFMKTAQFFSSRLNLPTDFYAVDDYEESCRANGQLSTQRWTQRHEGGLLQKFDRLFVISTGMQEHYLSKHGVKSIVLPPIVPASEHRLPSYDRASSTRDLVFCGSINHLYIDTLVTAVECIKEYNRSNPSSPFRLVICCRNHPAQFAARFPGDPAVHYEIGLSDGDLMSLMSRSYATLLPYTFAAEHRIMVSTSFSCKISEAFQTRRPIVVFGPSYASIPRHFLENDLPLVATSRESFVDVLRQIDTIDEEDLLRLYSEVVEKWHSPRAQRRILELHED